MSLKHPEILEKERSDSSNPIAELLALQHPEILKDAQERSYNSESHWDEKTDHSALLMFENY